MQTQPNHPHAGHRERLKHRFINEGLELFEPHQILELLLFYAIPRRDTNEIAHELLNRFGSLSSVLESDIFELSKVDGISENTAVFLSLVRQAQAYYSRTRYGEKPVLDSSSKAGNYAVTLFDNKKYETFYVVCLDTQNRVNRCQALSEGTISETAFYARNLVEIVLRHNAKSVIVAHNHPGGSLKPSTADINTTRNIQSALSTIDVKLVDHIIVGFNEYMSFAERGLL